MITIKDTPIVRAPVTEGGLPTFHIALQPPDSGRGGRYYAKYLLYHGNTRGVADD